MNINRKNVNESQVKAQDFPKSGFDLSYKSRADFILGRLHPVSYQYIMPADKFSFSCDVKHTFNNLVVPEISDVNVSLHHFFVPFRAIDSTFIKGIVPNELNGMSASWRVPSFSLYNLFGLIISQFTSLGSDFIAWANGTNTNMANSLVDEITNSSWDSSTEDIYYLTFVDDWVEFINTTVPSGAIPFTEDNVYLFLTALLKPLFGENSLLDVLGYAYLRTSDIRAIAKQVFAEGQNADMSSVQSYLSKLPQSEYALRAYYAIWFEYYRDKFIEKVSTYLPDWRDFGSASIFQQSEDLLVYLSVRVRSWSEDMFTTAKPDDICRHVFAPILQQNVTMSVSDDTINYQHAESAVLAPGQQGYSNLQFYDLKYVDPNTGVTTSVRCPIPKAVNDVLNNLDTTLRSVDTLALDLRDLRKSQMLERYLKRNFYFGDEYQDRMLAHYGSKVSDNSIKRPHLIASDGSQINPKQEIASMSTSAMNAGERTATVQDNTTGASTEFFSEEFGIFMTIMSVVPRAQYAGLCPQNLLSQMTDFPLPEFAASNDETGRCLEVAVSGAYNPYNYQEYQFGHYPYAHAWRSRVDEVHGSYLSTKQNWTFRRFFGLDTDSTTPHLNYRFLHCRPNLGMLRDTVRLNGQGYYTADNHFWVERVLPTPVEEI